MGFNDGGGYPKFGGDIKQVINNKNYYEHYLFSGHFAFSRPQFFEEISLDPFIQFAGDECIIALRASTRGYRIFSVSPHIVWHLNKHNFKDPEDRLMNPGDPRLVNHYHSKNYSALKRVRDILTGEILGH
jgi:hypothetical protein